MGRVHRVLPVSARARIEISSGSPIRGQVVWTKDLLIGIQFDEAIDVMQILHTHSEGGTGGTHRMPRLDIISAARSLVGGTSRDVRLVGISQGGAKIEAEYLRLGDQVVSQSTD